jgi:hypothetical protein
LSEPSRYPEAEWRGDGESGGSYTSGPWKVVLHTTETEGIPSYDGGATAPHLTYYPKARRWVQHTSFLTAARALRNETGGVQTNRDSAIQVEIVAYSAKGIADDDPRDRLWVGALTEEQLADIGAFLRWTYKEFGVKPVWPGRQAFSYAEANKSGFRMSLSEWDRFGGVCAHQHVPENTHWDTGALKWSALMEEQLHVASPPSTYAAPAWNAILEAGGIFSEGSDPHEALSKQDFAVFLMRLGVIEKGPDGKHRVDLDLRGALDQAISAGAVGAVDTTARKSAAAAQARADSAHNRLDAAKAAI